MNLHRRNLSESQRAMVAAKLADMPNGGNRAEQQGANLHGAAEAAEKLNVSERSVKTAKKVQTKATPELREKVEQGQVSVSAAATAAALPVVARRTELAEHAGEAVFGEADGGGG